MADGVIVLTRWIVVFLIIFVLLMMFVYSLINKKRAPMAPRP